MNRWLALLGMVVCAVPATASYELLLVADANRKSVFRFDPVTGQSLGSFGNGRLAGAISIGVSATRGEAYVLETPGFVTVWDYSTGLFRRNMAVSSGVNGQLAVMPNGDLMITDGFFTIRRYSSNGAPLREYSDFTSGTSFRSVTPVGDNIVVWNRIAGSSGSQFRILNSNFGVLRNLTAGSIRNASQFGSDGKWMAYADGSFGIAEALEFAGNGDLTDANFTFLDSGVFSTVTSTAIGHGRMTYFAGRNGAGTAGQIAVWNPVFSGFRGTFGSGQLVDPTSMAIVVAPEPGTLLALTLGLAALARRRRRP